MSVPTTAARAAQARLRRRSTPAVARGTGALKDPCPTCGVELGQPHGASRRLAVLTGDRGVFSWRCPDCRSAWTERASTQSGSTTRSSGPTA